VDRLQLQVIGGGSLLDHGVLLEAVGQLGVCRWGEILVQRKSAVRIRKHSPLGPFSGLTQRSVSVRNARPKR
jgi:hypothetical protein